MASDSSTQPSVAPITLINMLEYKNNSLAPGRPAKVPDVDILLLQTSFSMKQYRPVRRERTTTRCPRAWRRQKTARIRAILDAARLASGNHLFLKPSTSSPQTRSAGNAQVGFQVQPPRLQSTSNLVYLLLLAFLAARLSSAVLILLPPNPLLRLAGVK